MESKKPTKVETQLCNAARFITTQQNAVDAILKGTSVYLIPVEQNGKTKMKPYCQCSRKAYESNHYCWKHSTCDNKLNFFDDIINNSSTKKAELSDFKKVQKKSNIGNLLSPNGATNNKQILRIKMTDIIFEKFLEIKKELEEIESKTSIKAEKTLEETFEFTNSNNSDNNESDTDEQISILTKKKLNLSSNEKSKESDNEDSDNEDSDNEDSDNEKSDNEDSDNEDSDNEDSDNEKSDNEDSDNEKSDNEDSDNEESENETTDNQIQKELLENDSDNDDMNSDGDSDDEADCEEITTQNGIKLYLDKESKSIYKLDSSGEGVLTGTFKEVNDSKSACLYQGKYYAIAEDIGSKNQFRCTITNRVYEKKKNSKLALCIGRAKQGENNIWHIITKKK